jgi:hypothetical protein
MKNITQSVVFPVSTILTKPVPSELKEAFLTWGEIQDDTERAAKRKELLGLMPKELKEEVESFGAELPYDSIVINMKLGMLFMDCYLARVKPTESPLGRLVFQKKAQELAQELNKEEFEIPEWAQEPIRVALYDENVWKTVSPTVWVDVAQEPEKEPTKKHFTLNSRGANFFNQIISAASEAVYNSELG